ncbi:O-antigen ligase family protein [Mitsuokella multacida]|uniref:O-antigen ligase family protein n=1 Tax=Mitsuokella multacida TaxID=52226 RepID=UPI002666805F|nr:O-antigen ligase family protein [Mitsuokella multacida]
MLKYKFYVIRFQYIMLLLTILALPIFGLTKRLQFLPLGGKLSYHFAMLGIIALGIEWLFFRFKFDYRIKSFLLIFISWQLLSLAFGLYHYPYYQEINWQESEKLSRLVEFSITHNLDYLDLNNIEAVWLGIRVVKDALINFIFTFGVSVWIIHLFHDSFSIGFITIRKCILILTIALGIYAIPEILLFKFKMDIGYDILSVTNAFLYDIGGYLDWYPPLIWLNEQVRSYCTEPAIFGGLAATIIPMLWSYCREEFKISALYVYFIMLLFMTKSRTSNAIAIFSSFWLVLGCFNNKIRKWSIVLIVLTVLGFALNIGLNFVPVASNSHQEGTDSYFDNNIKSIVEKDSRSNGSRLINIIGHINVIQDHWLVGVGRGLEACYVRDNLPDNAYSNDEIVSITKEIDEKGPLTGTSYGNVNNFIYIFTNEGCIGLVIYLLPFIYALWMVFKLRLWRDNRYIFISIAILGNLLSEMAGEGGMLLYIMLGLLYVGIQENKHSVIQESSEIVENCKR